MDFWTRIESLRRQCNVLEHPFYQRWSAGELSREELVHYAGEYHHAVLALAQASQNAAAAVDPALEPDLRHELEGHAAEEQSHVELWEDFTHALGGSASRTPNTETLACYREWAGDGSRPLLDSLVALYAIESGQPAISATKRVGLREHYGLGEGRATAYFALHEQLDIEHADAARALIDERLCEVDQERLLTQAERVLRANWLLLDGVERANANLTATGA